MPNVARMVEDIVGCKWSLAVLGVVRDGVCRPGAMEHAIDGLSKKVLNERLNKLVNDQLATPDASDNLRKDGAIAAPTTPEAFQAQIASEIEVWRKVIQQANIRIAQ